MPPGGLCRSDHRDLQGVAHLVAPFAYAGTGGALVRRFKLDADAAAGLFLVRAMVRAWLAAPLDQGWRRAVVVAVPLHWRRRRSRGFDHGRWIARQVVQRLGLPLGDRVLARLRATLPQGDPRVTSREGNVDGAFGVTRPGRVAGRRVLLVDDVITSGATARACAARLREAGASQVAVLVACRS